MGAASRLPRGPGAHQTKEAGRPAGGRPAADAPRAVAARRRWLHLPSAGRRPDLRHSPRAGSPGAVPVGPGGTGTMTPAERLFRRSSWTARPESARRRSRPSPACSRRVSACATSSTSRATRASPSRSCRSSSPRSTRRAAGRSSASSPTTPRHGTPPRAPAGISARSGSACLPRAACAGAAGSSRRRTSSANGRGRSRFSAPEGSCARRRSGRPRESCPRRGGRSRSSSGSVTSRG
jgi:hypothetical protein